MAQHSRLRTGLSTLAGAALIIGGTWFGIDSLGHSDSAAPKSSSTPTSANSAQSCTLNSLPPEAKKTVSDIKRGGPFQYPDNDGVRFGNYEGLLPDQARNYYREYTVRTPGVHHRGARRIITGGDPATDPQHWYYTGDHYESFCEIPDANH